ncbi:hypothetical protein, partial [Serratia marcescens]|uniref:hypothetical protein n=1 Tax=Serratia marcescens TaxID=615 RepID=UPI001C651139
ILTQQQTENSPTNRYLTPAPHFSYKAGVTNNCPIKKKFIGKPFTLCTIFHLTMSLQYID